MLSSKAGLKSWSEKIAFSLNQSQLHYFEVTKNNYTKQLTVSLCNSLIVYFRVYIKHFICELISGYVVHVHLFVNKFTFHQALSGIEVVCEIFWVYIKQVTYYFYNNKIKLRPFEGCAKSTMHRFNQIFRTLDPNCTLLNGKTFEENRKYVFSSCLNNLASVRFFFQISIINILYLF